VSADLVGDLSEVRELLEPVAVRQAVPRLSPSDLSRMRDILRGSERALAEGDFVALALSNQAFHRMFIDHATNAYLRSVLAHVQDQVHATSVVTWMAIDICAREHDEHLAILEATCRGEAAEASGLMATHIATFKEVALRALQRRRPSALGELQPLRVVDPPSAALAQ
jgi:DNA-binding GntR family transcriptional regulator